MLSGFRNLRTAVFISGGGSTLQALLECAHQNSISLVISNRKNALGLLKAKRFGIPVILIGKDSSFEDLSCQLRAHNIGRVVLAGFMKLLPADFVNQWKNKIVNIHPSLLPQFPGLNAIENNWVSKSSMGVTIHFVDEQMDSGNQILQMVSLNQYLSFDEASLFLRRTEQHVLRELSMRWCA